MNTTLPKIFGRKYDPVYSCAVYRTDGCAHVDGLLCDFPSCSVLADYYARRDFNSVANANNQKEGVRRMNVMYKIKRVFRGIRRGWLGITGIRMLRYFYIQLSRVARDSWNGLKLCDAQLARLDSYGGAHSFWRAERSSWLRLYKASRNNADHYLPVNSPARHTPLR